MPIEKSLDPLARQGKSGEVVAAEGQCRDHADAGAPGAYRVAHYVDPVQRPGAFRAEQFLEVASGLAAAGAPR